jgi:hypothetical protein
LIIDIGRNPIKFDVAATPVTGVTADPARDQRRLDHFWG